MAAERLGSHWIHEMPSEEQVREWFANQRLHPGMEHDPYLGGIVLIGAKEKVNVTKEKQNGDTYVSESERATFVPYVKVDTRIAYFRDYVRVLNGGEEAGDFVGIIEPVEQPRIKNEASAYFNGHLPDGFTLMPVRNNNDSVSRFLVATFRVAIYERQSYGERIAGRPALPILQGVGTKQTALARNWADDNALMKAETGAIGRALGVAGILVVGTGVATAEDMQEAAAGPAGAAASSGEGATLPADVGGGEAGAAMPQEAAAEAQPEAALPDEPEVRDQRLRLEARDLQQELRQGYPAQWAAYAEWWRGRFGEHRLDQLSGPALVGAVTKLERDLDEAKRAPGAAAEEVAPS